MPREVSGIAQGHRAAAATLRTDPGLPGPSHFREAFASRSLKNALLSTEESQQRSTMKRGNGGAREAGKAGSSPETPRVPPGAHFPAVPSDLPSQGGLGAEAPSPKCSSPRTRPSPRPTESQRPVEGRGGSGPTAPWGRWAPMLGNQRPARKIFSLHFD